jgi:uncharacterized membrane protein YccC
MRLNSDLRQLPRRFYGRCRAWTAKRRSEIRLALRMTVAAVASYVLVHLLDLPQGYWAVFTAVLIMQTSIGGSLQAIIDRLIGTLGGASYGAVVATLVPHENVMAMGAALTLSLAPLALAAAVNPSFRVAPITAVIVLLGNAGLQEGPEEAAFYRTIAVALGSLVGLGVALTVLPARAHNLMGHAANRMLGLLARLFAALLQGLTQPANDALTGQLHDDIRIALTKLETVASEAARERRSHLTDEPDPEPLPRTLRRLRHDLVMIGRCAAEPLPETLRATLAHALAKVSDAVVAFLRAAGVAIENRSASPAFVDVDEALVGYAVSLAAQRDAGRALPTDVAERIYALGFALEQLRRDCKDLSSRIEEFARSGKKPA